MEQGFMQKCADMKTFSAAVMSMMKRGVLTNCFIGNAAVSAAVNDGSLSLCGSENGLYILRDFPHAVRMNYYVFPPCKISEFGLEKPIVTEVSVKNASELSEVERVQINMLRQSGFELYTERTRLERPGGTAHKDRKVFPKAFVFRLSEKDIQTEACRKAHELLCTELDGISGCVPSYAEFCGDVLSGLVYGVTVCGKTAGVLRVSTGKKACEIRQLAVGKSFRRQGLAKSLVSEFLAQDVGADKACGVWTGSTNNAAVALYKSFGFEQSAMRSFVYLRK